MFMLIEERRQATNQNMQNIYLQREKMERPRQWMSPGILLIKTIPRTEKGEGETKGDAKGKEESESV